MPSATFIAFRATLTFKVSRCLYAVTISIIGRREFAVAVDLEDVNDFRTGRVVLPLRDAADS